LALSRLRAALGHRFMPVVLAVLAVALTLPSLDAGLIADDYYLRWTVMGSRDYQGIAPAPWDMWRFFDGNPQRTERMMDLGLLPWWTFPQLKGAFWRPVAAATHVVDFRLWPQFPALMHAHSLLWFGLLVACVAMLYRRLLAPAWVAGLAGLLYAVDDAHGMPVAMLANRNALLATLFGVLALLAHDRWRRNRWAFGIVAGPALLAASLLSAEAGVGTCAYLLAYALFLDGGTRGRRFASLLPYAAVTLVWLILWNALGYGVYGIEEVYNSPFADPLGFAALIVKRAPLYILGQWALPPAETHLLLGKAGNLWLWVGGLAMLIILAVLLYPLCRRSKTARFWAAGMLLAVIPPCATGPMNRQLFFVGLGAMGLLAQFLQEVFSTPAQPAGRSALRKAAMCLGVVFIFIHLVIAPLGLVAFSKYPLGPKSVLAGFHNVPGMGPSVAGQDLVVVNHPLPVHMIHMLAGRVTAGQPVPRHTRVLASSASRLTVYRPDDRTLLVRPAAGYCAQVSDRLARGLKHPMALGQQVTLTGMTVTVTELTADNRPAEARFEFSVPLEDRSLLWIQWKDGAFRPFVPPAVGQTITLPAFTLPL